MAAKGPEVMSRIRRIRNRYLADCDWTQMPDNGMADELRTRWASYRQQLRDITDNLPDEGPVIWPDPPNVAR